VVLAFLSRRFHIPKFKCEHLPTGVSIWTQSGSINSSLEFLTTPKVAASAVDYPSVTAKLDLDTVEVRSSSLLVPTIYFIESALSRAAVSPRVDPTRHLFGLGHVLIGAFLGGSGAAGGGGLRGRALFQYLS
jgi:hypothetical protein